MIATQQHKSPTLILQFMKHRFFLTIVLALLSLQVSGSHLRGMSVWYETTGQDTIEVHNQYYYECTGVVIAAYHFANMTGVGTGCNAPVPISASSTVSLMEITPSCPSAVSSCISSTWDYYGVMVSHTTRAYDISGLNCTEYDISAATCCRNPSIQNLVSASNTSGASTARVSLAGLQAGNSSPSWNEDPTLYVFDLNNTTVYNQSATDPDGDSLVYFLAAATSDNGVLVPYNAGYSATNPLGSNWQVDLDPVFGLLTFTPVVPNSFFSAVVVVGVEEYRNGVLLGTYTRDMSIVGSLLPNTLPSNPPTVVGLQNAGGGGVIVGDTLLVSPNSAYSVDIQGNDIDPGDITILTAFWNGTSSYTFSDTNVVVFDSVSGQNPIARFTATAPGQGTFRLVVGARDFNCGTPQMDTREFTVIVGDTGLVWPGDANDDLVADVNDLLAIGLSFGNTGAARSGASNNWIGQFAFPWLDTIQGGVDFKHQDCNGSGIVNADDTLAIVLNYGLTHNKTGGVNGGPNDPPLFMVLPTDTAMVGDTLHAPIYLGDSGNAVSNAYGIAFTLNYDATLIDSNSFYITFDNNWMGMAPNALDLSINMHTMNRCDAAFVRTDHQSQNGMGRIGTAHFIIIDNIDGKRNLLIADTLPLSFSNVNLIGLDGEVIPVNAMPSELIVTDESVDRVEPGFEIGVHVYPNPAQEAVTVETVGYPIESLIMYDLHGKELLRKSSTTDQIRIGLHGLPGGLYFIHIKTEVGTTVKKLLVK